ncbi:MAG: RdgB/HAM1 family non-canonical purine NTP pyrophosphatase [Clostridiales bacterium]|nr:RdgB/HAM1 family non-canonical purine NTP pyrophosphatase [Clostridiales bacterium]MDD7523241.1 RdgB/HAM1 family non-canonical purine NTP pyrophosphatase [Clostridiales bacterium]MDD7688501.1 RdgB/HAM1 family non-canonical purine NTP pyrophosphatase [Clostridiales bacterium]MDY2598222.1 RdgB/HAM1 family non-canonical purine NTP pyrophosphatase [Eubacteriales bacterium]MDY4621624.1 RdgB/HAM1 family non-canonical purine NTP pyrophosphatase [Eubacteriales bacterium]
MRLVIASNNKNKVREIKEILGDRFDAVIPMREAGIELDVVEDADSFMGNARKKAVEAAALLPDDAVLADDSGLCVDALGGAPGVYSARYAGEGHDDAANRKKLLEALSDVPFSERNAHFACAMVLIRPGCGEINAYGRVDGKIMFEERGENGFGYDSLFLYEPENLSFAEIDAERKNAVSHRRNALMLVLAALKE